MRTVSFRSVIHGAAGSMVPDPEQLSTAEFTAYTKWVNRWLREAWERFEWPELCPTEERWYRSFWDVGVTYDFGDEVYHAASDAYWRCIAGGALAEVPGDSPFWEQCGVDDADPLDRYVALDQPGETPIGTVLRMYPSNPKRLRQPELAFAVSAEGIQVPGWTGASVWLQFRRRPSVFTSVRYANATAYAKGSSVYYPATGDCYAALSAPPTGTVPTNAAYWGLIPFPYALSTHVEMRAFAEALKDDGQYDKAKAQAEEAEEVLMMEWHKAESQQRQVRRSLVETR